MVGNRFISLSELCKIVKCPCNIFNLEKLKKALPDHWKRAIKDEGNAIEPLPDPEVLLMGNNKTVHIVNITSKQIYNMLSKCTDRPVLTCKKYWKKKFNEREIDENQWISTFRFKIRNRLNNQLGQFQYNLLNNLIPCKHNLYKWKIKDSEMCDVCNVLGDYNHFFIDCKHVKKFWRRWKSIIFNLTKLHLNINMKLLVYGYKIQEPDNDFINMLIIFGAYSVYKAQIEFTKNSKFIPIFFLFTNEIKKFHLTQKYSKRKIRLCLLKEDLDNLFMYFNVY